jgi:transposase
MDEHRLGLKPILRRVWCRRGSSPVAQVYPRYEWVYVYGFVHPESGRTFWLVMPRVNTEAMSAALAEFAREVGAGKERRVLLVLDGAGWHVSRGLVVPEGIELVKLPAYSPELQPAERLWSYVDEPFANVAPKDLASLEQTLVERCQYLGKEHDLLRGPTLFHWWPRSQDLPRSA